MSWKESTTMDEKLKFIARYLEGETITDLWWAMGIDQIQNLKNKILETKKAR